MDTTSAHGTQRSPLQRIPGQNGRRFQVIRGGIWMGRAAIYGLSLQN
uniref:Uncharacterized protein n=1 Tax=Picea sitchensis TaxID=3332 RepID=A9NP60_PICSI|nr:unknown [Picea sitchensis]